MNIWGRGCLRMSDIDFKAASHDGVGVDWPITYAEIKPYYDLVEEYVGVSGHEGGTARSTPDGPFQPPMGLTCNEMAVRSRVKKAFGYTVTQGRTANLTKPINGRQACHYCGPCEHGCITHSYFNSAFTTMKDAMATGRCTLVTGAMAYKVLMDPDTHRARGVLYIDRTTRQPREIFGRAVALCAQTLESVRMLFNSATPPGPERPRELERRVGQVPDDAFRRRRCLGRIAGSRRAADDGGRESPVRATDAALPQPAGRAEDGRVRARLRAEHVRRRGCSTSRPGDTARRTSALPSCSRAPRRSASPGSASACPTRTTRAPSTRTRWTPSASRCAPAHLTPRENERALHRDMATARAPRSSKASARRTSARATACAARRTRSAPRAWARTRGRPCSRRSCRRTTSATCS